MTIQELFVRSNEALLTSVLKIKANQWEMYLPPGMSRQPTNLVNAVRYHTYDDAWVPDVLDGRTAKQVGDKYEHLLTGSDVAGNYEEYNKRAQEAVRGFSELKRIVHLSYGDFPARDYLQHIISFRAFRSYDIAKLIGVDTTMEPALVNALIKEFSPVVEGYRQMGVFPQAISVSSDAPAQTKLLAMVGRS